MGCYAVCCIILQSISALVSAPEVPAAIPINVSGPWSVRVGPGSGRFGGRTVAIPEAVKLQVPRPERVRVRDEVHRNLPVFDEKGQVWKRGASLARLVTEECTATGLVVPETVRVKPAPGEVEPFVPDKDVRVDAFWAQVGRIEGGAIAPDQRVFIDYDYIPSRLDSVAVNFDGDVRLVVGTPGIGAMLPPELEPGYVAVANIWISERPDRLSDENLFPIEPDPLTIEPPEPVAERLLPRTLGKLRAGEDVTIVAWGDSVTAGGGVGDKKDVWYQNQFAARLQARFPRAHITMLTAAWPGGNSAGYMSAPKGGPYDFERDVLAPKPDLVTIEFVNDAYLDVEQTQAHYAKIMERLRSIGAEVILITPHLVRPDWMGVSTLKFDEDPRPYVKGLRKFAKAHNIALADASKLWCRLWRRGIPYVTLEANSINHPDARGHGIFADALMGLFPEE